MCFTNSQTKYFPENHKKNFTFSDRKKIYLKAIENSKKNIVIKNSNVYPKTKILTLHIEMCITLNKTDKWHTSMSKLSKLLYLYSAMKKTIFGWIEI